MKKCYLLLFTVILPLTFIYRFAALVEQLELPITCKTTKKNDIICRYDRNMLPLQKYRNYGL